MINRPSQLRLNQPFTDHSIQSINPQHQIKTTINRPSRLHINKTTSDHFNYSNLVPNYKSRSLGPNLIIGGNHGPTEQLF